MAQPWGLVIILLMKKCQRPECRLFCGKNWRVTFEKTKLDFRIEIWYDPVFDSLRKKKWLYPRFNEGCSHFSFCNDMCYIFFVPGFTCLVSLMIVRIDDFVINS